MQSHPLTLVADQYLRQAPRTPETPAYSEHSFRRKVQIADKRDVEQPLESSLRPWEYLHQEEMAGIVELAKLTRAQKEVMELRLRGLTFEQIAQQRGTSRQGSLKVYYQGAKKLMAAFLAYPYRGLPQVYEEEILRGAPWLFRRQV